MKIEQLPINDVIPYEFNSRKHDEVQVDRIANSIKEFGFNQPIVIDESNIVVVGHGRLLAARKLGLSQVPVLKKLGLSEAQKKAYRILDNKLQNDSSWEFNNLELDLGFLEDNDFDLKPWGLDTLRDLFEPEQEAHEDDFDPAQCENEECFIKRGDALELGRHKIWCEDIKEADPLPNLANLWITDPPYGVSYVGKTKDALTIENDNLGDDGTAELWRAATKYALESLEDGAACYATVPPGPLNYIFLKEWVELLVYHQQLIWAKDSMVLGHSDYHYKHEPILYGWKPGGAHYFTEDRTKTSIIEVDRPKASREHPMMKPIGLWGELIANSTKAGAIVLDTFLGSGTTLIACEQLGRTCYGMEIEPKYCHVIIERYRKHCADNNKEFECKVNGQPYA